MARVKKQEAKTQVVESGSRYFALLRDPDRFEKLEDGWFHDRLLGNRDWAPLEMIKHITWAQAKEYSKSIGGMLPEDFEIESLIDRSRKDPAIHPAFSTIKTDDWYWTNTPLAKSDSWVWCAVLDGGDMSINHEDDTLFVWPVRSSQCRQSDLLPVR